MFKTHRSLCVAFSRTGAGLCIYHLLVWSNLNFLQIFQWITLPTQSCLALYSFCANLLRSLIRWLMVSSLPPHSLHLLFCWVLSILTLIWLVLTALSCTALRRDSVSLIRFPFLSQVQVFWCEMLFIRRLKRPWCCFSSHSGSLVVVIFSSIVLSVSFLMVVISPRLCLLLLLLLLLFTPLEFFTSVLADDFSLEFQWQRDSSSLQDSSQYFGRFQ